MYACMYVMDVHNVSAWCPGNQKKGLEPLELKLQAVVICTRWVLGKKPVSSTRAASSRNHCASLQPFYPVSIEIV